MKRTLMLIGCALVLALAFVSCGGGGDNAAPADKLTIIGAGS